jgi:ketosteroid isomerase-like protein
MDEKEIERIIRDFVDSLEKKDIDISLSHLTDDAKWFNNEGAFKGKEEIKKYITWMSKTLMGLKFTDDGVGIIAKGNKAVYQGISESTYEGIKIRVNYVCTYEFSGDKIKNHWTISDRLSMAKQAVTGPIAKKVVNTVVARMEKGLH